MELAEFIATALREDIGDGDHSSLASVPQEAQGKAQLLVKEDGVLAGVRVAREVFKQVDPELNFEVSIEDGEKIKVGDVVGIVSGRAQSILKAERLVLNLMQRMSGIATQTRTIVDILEGTSAKVLDTRKTTPVLRALEKEAVRLGGGYNHRFGLYDMVMLKDNHLDYAGGIAPALESTRRYLTENSKDLKIEVEARDLQEVQEILDAGGADRIMLDNFNYADTKTAVALIGDRCETESSGGITMETIRPYAECGVDYISVGALTHSVKSLDLSLKAL